MSGVNINIKLNKKDLKNLKDGLKSGAFVKVGILGDGAARDDGVTNPELGVIHELGSATRNIPPRSFLRMPLTTKKDELGEAFRSKTAKKALEEGNIEGVLDAVGVKALEIVNEAFVSGGFGAWPPNKPATVRRKGSSKPLIDTGELRRAQSYEVVSGKEA